MKRTVAIISAAIALTVANVTHAQWAYYNNDCPQWSFDMSVVALQRPGSDNAITLISNDVTLAPVFTSDQATDLNTAAGVDFSFTTHTRQGFDLEFETSYAKWDQEYQFLGPNLATPFLPGLSPDFIDYNYNSQLFSFEINARRECAAGVTFLMGPRFVYLREHTDFDTSTQITPPVPAPIFDFTTQTEIDSSNPLLGGQVGLELDFQVAPSVSVNGFIKAGGFNNWAQADIRTTTTFAATTVDRRTKNTGSFVGEVGGRLNFEIFPSALTGFIGYQAMWIDGVALAPPQFINVNNNGSLFVENTPFFQGAIFGFQARY